MKGESSKVKEVWLTGLGYEDLVVWNRAVDFAVQVIDAVETISADRKHFRLLEQIEASSTSMAMNLAEGKGRFSQKEFIQYCTWLVI